MSPSPRLCLSSPLWNRDDVGAPGVSSPSGPPPSLGVESSHDNSNPHPFVCGVKSSFHETTPSPPPPHWGSNRSVTTRPPRPLRGRSNHPRTNRPPPPLLGGPSWGFPPLWRPCGPPPPIPLRGDWGPLWRPCGPQSFPPPPRGLHTPNLGGLPFSQRFLFAPHGGSASPPSAVPEVTFPPPLPLALAPTLSPRAPLSCVPHGDTVSRACSSSPSSVSASDVASLPPLYPLHPSLSSPPALPPPTSLVALQPLAPAHALLPPAPAADIARRGEDVGDRTGGVVTRRSLVGGSAPRGKWPRRPRLVVGDGKSRPRSYTSPSSSTPCTASPRS